MDVGSMKYGEFGNIHKSLISTKNAAGETVPPFIDTAKIQQNFGKLTQGERETIAATLTDVLNNPQARANAGDRLAMVVQTAQALNQAGGVTIDIKAEDASRFGVPTTPVDSDTGDAGDAGRS